MSIKLSGDALSYLPNMADTCTTYDDDIDLLRKLYNSDEKRAQILTAWKKLTLSEEMSRSPNSTEVVILREFGTRLVSLHK